MSDDDTPMIPPRDPENPEMRERVLAAEYSLGLLEGEELLAARGREATDADFAARREWWDNWFVPLSDGVSGAQPGDHVWAAIAAQVDARTGAGTGTGDAGGTDNVVLLDMERRLTRWKWTAAITSAAAAVALALFAFGPNSNPVSQDTPELAANEAAAPLMASIPIGDTALRLGVTFLPASAEILVSAAGLSADGVHDHELWLVPEDGSAAQSLGVVVPGEERRFNLSDSVAAKMGDGVKLLLTREPLGGKPENQDAGPVVAEGALQQV
ncbi:MAG: anti-sigma factor [Erythrobacter sp.]